MPFINLLPDESIRLFVPRGDWNASMALVVSKDWFSANSKETIYTEEVYINIPPEAIKQLVAAYLKYYAAALPQDQLLAIARAIINPLINPDASGG